MKHLLDHYILTQYIAITNKLHKGKTKSQNIAKHNALIYFHQQLPVFKLLDFWGKQFLHLNNIFKQLQDK